MNFSIQLLLLAAVMLFAMQPTHAALKCSIATLRQCNSTNNSSCCQQLHSDPYFKMETGFYIGNILVNNLLNHYETSTNTEVCDNDNINTLKSLSQLLIYYQSSAAIPNTSDDSDNNTLNLDVTSAFSFLLKDIEEVTCNWIAECFPGLSCSAYLNLLSLDTILKERPRDTSIVIGPVWRLKWAEDALCDHGDILKFRSISNYKCI